MMVFDFIGCAGFHQLILFVAAWCIGSFDELCNNGFRTTGTVFVGVCLQFLSMLPKLKACH
jgi:hypothetical protein